MNCGGPMYMEERGDVKRGEVGNFREHEDGLLRRGEDFGRIRRDSRESAGDLKSTTAESANHVLARSKGGGRLRDKKWRGFQRNRLKRKITQRKRRQRKSPQRKRCQCKRSQWEGNQMKGWGMEEFQMGGDITESRRRYRGREYLLFAYDKRAELVASEAPKRVRLHASDRSRWTVI